MQLAIVSDIHANAEALRAVLADIRRAGADMVVSLGDLVGYNTQPQETIALLRSEAIPSVYGNHELMVTGTLDLKHCGIWGARAAQWTRTVLTPDERRYLAGLPGAMRVERDLLFVHSRLGDPVRRLREPDDFAQHGATILQWDRQVRVCFTGHTHRPLVAEVSDGDVALYDDQTVTLAPDRFYFVNPGSVGQPRGEDTRAAYALFDADRNAVTLRRVTYPARRTMRRNRRHGIHVDLGSGRLTNGAPMRPRRVTLHAIAGRLARLVS